MRPYPTLPTIPLSECKHGYVYKISSRNLSFGVFNSKTNGFMGIRSKRIGYDRLEDEYHIEVGPSSFGTARPKIELEKCPIQNLNSSLGSACYGCNKPVEYTNPDTPPHWIHTNPEDNAKCLDVQPYGVNNDELFEYLDTIYSKYKKYWDDDRAAQKAWEEEYKAYNKWLREAEIIEWSFT